MISYFSAGVTDIQYCRWIAGAHFDSRPPNVLVGLYALLLFCRV